MPFQTLRFLLDHPLTSRHPAQAIARYVRWQLSSRLALGPVAVKFVNDARLLVRPGMTGATGNVYAGLHDFADMAFMLHALRKDDLFADVGANVGAYTVLAARVAGARVIAFEPAPAAHAALLDNIRLNGIGERVDVRAACVGSETGTARVTTAEDTTNHVVPRDTAHASDPVATLEVPLTSLDAALAGRPPLLIKLDIEGYELEALRGARFTLQNPELRAIIMEINSTGLRYGRSDTELEQLVLTSGFRRCEYLPFERRLVEVVTPQAKVDGNALFVRDIEFVSERVRSAQAFEVLNLRI
jgi:FkbM family methyltransferase